jgi:hypothetical protein
MKHIKLFEQFVNEALPEGVIRVFRTKAMKDWVKDVTEDDIKTRDKDLKVRDYLVNQVVLKDGTKGWVWSKNETFED